MNYRQREAQHGTASYTKAVLSQADQIRATYELDLIIMLCQCDILDYIKRKTAKLHKFKINTKEIRSEENGVNFSKENHASTTEQVKTNTEP